MGAALRKPRGVRARSTVENKYTKPCGWYVHRGIDTSRLKKLILAGKLAPCFPGVDSEDAAEGSTLEECPICMLVRRGALKSWACAWVGRLRGRLTDNASCAAVLPVAQPEQVLQQGPLHRYARLLARPYARMRPQRGVPRSMVSACLGHSVTPATRPPHTRFCRLAHDAWRTSAWASAPRALLGARAGSR